jgi:hypothetical protein
MKLIRVPQTRPIINIIPLVMASGTGNANSTENAKPTLTIGTSEKPSRSIQTASTKGFFNGRDRECKRFVTIAMIFINITSFL